MDNKTPTTVAKPASDNISARMSAVKMAWDAAPDGPKKDAALTHYQAAQKAHTARNDAECHRELDAAKHALV
jgi:hypothetical protein